MLEWTDQFVTGSPIIDEQHRTLIANLNRLEALLKTTNPSREDCEFIIGLVTYLEAYTREHFQFEEECMAIHRCPAGQKNRQAHEAFLQFFRQFHERYVGEGFRPEVLATLHGTISAWIREHILRIDTQLRPCLKPPPAADAK